MSYNRPLTIEKPVASPTEDDFGHTDWTDDSNWKTHWSGWCKIESRGGSEFFRVSRLVAQLQYLLTIRWCTDCESVKPENYRVKFLGRVFTISFVENVNDANREIQIGCTEWIDP